MLKAIAAALQWSVIYFFAYCALLRIAGYSSSLFAPSPEALMITFVISMGYFYGYLHGSEDRDSNAVLRALVWGVLYFFVDCSVRLLFLGSASFFEQGDAATAESLTSALGYLFGCCFAKTD